MRNIAPDDKLLMVEESPLFADGSMDRTKDVCFATFSEVNQDSLFFVVGATETRQDFSVERD